MAFENQTVEIIRARMLKEITSAVNKEEGSFTYDALSPAAVELSNAYMALDSVLRRAFAQTSYGEDLDNKASEFGVYRKSGTKASGTVTFKGLTNTVIPEGFLVQTEGGLQYAVKTQVKIIGETVTATVEAVEIGNTYNVLAGKINQIAVPMAGLSSVTNALGFTGGTDDESDDDLRERLLLKVRTPATSGNIHHYKLWALEVDGVGGAKVFPLWNGAGTVKVTVIDSNKQPATQAIIDAAKAHIEDNRPVGATVTVNTATTLTVNIVMNIKKDNSRTFNDIQAAIVNKIDDYIKDVAFETNYISVNKIITLVMGEPGVVDLMSLILNGGTGNVAVNSEQIAVLGTVTINEQV